MDWIKAEGGVSAAAGFTAAGINAGLRKNKAKLDLALIKSEVPAVTAAVYTQNLVKGAPIVVTQKNLSDGMAQAVIVNSGNANTCNADGIEKAQAMCALCAQAADVAENAVVVASTGVIGQVLDIEPIKKNIGVLAGKLSKEGHIEAAQAIMTTDTYSKEFAVRYTCGGKTVTVGGMAKGSGMIHPDMATLLCFLTTDAGVSHKLLQKALQQATDETFNMISVDGDTSTNDMAVLMANGLSGVQIKEEGAEYQAFQTALYTVLCELSKMLAADGEGATKLLECSVAGAASKEDAKKVAKSVITSSLFKAAMFGKDANWGRILCAVGYSKAKCDIEKIDVSIASEKGSVDVCKNGSGVVFSEEKALEILSEKSVQINITLQDGNEQATAWGCDLTYDYVKINGDYRS